MTKPNLRARFRLEGSREFFNGAPALELRRQSIAHLDTLDAGYCILPVEATKK